MIATQALRVTLPTPHAEQRVELYSSARFKISVHGRRWGKTTQCMIASLDGHGSGRWRGAVRGAEIWWVVPSYKIGVVQWRMLKAATRGAWSEKNELDRSITFPSGGRVTIKSADDPYSLVGEGLDGVVLDEWALTPHADIVWEESIRPALADRRGWAWFISSPKGKRNHFYRIFQKSKVSRHCASWQGPTTTATVDQEELDQAREELGPLRFKQEFLAEFVDAEAGFFREEWMRYYKRTGDVAMVAEKPVDLAKCRKVITVDLAVSTKESADYTVVTTSGITENRELAVIDMRRLRIEGPDHAPLIQQAFQAHRPEKILVESVAYQLSLVQELKRQGLPVVPVKRTKDKVSRACLLQARMSAGCVHLPEGANWTPVVVDELLSFPEGEHDDIVDTLADAADYAASGGGIHVW